ncbi:DNA-binding MarR family transcriptional regulator [Epilithonimonas hungarica]|uniref:MarR family winged helix-turn-helix transcriptional regulator n=1 Tax=Epilithonimonas hungarica TaxID=454006 RepID=UPI002781281B|nr:MarR family winged helix-turn-helix transcriptional regulator [Epilithonimonas hungarica]MDP9955429.1 DNA-binding MarR family transcriptional regulator [Epilithonimonas hungarica]
MNFDIIKAVVELVRQFMEQNESKALYSNDIHGFTKWMNTCFRNNSELEDHTWIGKESGRSSESVINTLLVRIVRYAKSYSRSIVVNSMFSSQDDFIYLISLNSLGSMSKMDLIRHNVHEKPAGMLVINRLINNGLVEQTISDKDKRIKLIQITKKGLDILDKHMNEIRKASKVVTANLTHPEQMILIGILSKLDEFHYSVYRTDLDATDLLDKAYEKLN